MKNRSFRLLWMSQALANSGDIFYIVGLISVLYSLTESPFILALVPFFNMFGRFVSGLFSPLLINRYPLKQLLVYSQFFKTVALGMLALLISLLVPVVPVVLAFVLMIAFLDGWATPASQSMLPRLVPPHELVKANSFFSIVYETINLGGWAIGGLLVAFLGGQWVIVFTVGCYTASTILLLYIVDATRFTGKEASTRRADELTEGWKTIWRHPLYRSLHILIAFEAIANVVWIASILYVFVAEVLQKSEAWWGYINTSFFIGMLLGGILFSRFASWGETKLKPVLLISSFGICIITFLFGYTQIGWLSLIIVCFSGIFQQLKGIATDTFLQKNATPEELPKIYAAQSTIVSLLFAIGSLVFGMLAEVVDVRITYLLAASLLFIASVHTYRQRRYLSLEK
ncbi:MFS transporter [Sporosarcina luteola]|uniref:MFS transporter n=1 Tax=Sporosarcina luteola TaxID=582850 RepID=A0A511Z8D4_9BACL|nr:MFS transporter [Sporosarcina luteola]GEN83674.1 MFS transporter [Sporosarcina luteola]